MFNLTGDEQIGIVYQTKDYSKFSFMKYNRDIDYRHVERLKKEMKDNDVDTPIQVTEKMEMISTISWTDSTYSRQGEPLIEPYVM